MGVAPDIRGAAAFDGEIAIEGCLVPVWTKSLGLGNRGGQHGIHWGFNLHLILLSVDCYVHSGQIRKIGFLVSANLLVT